MGHPGAAAHAPITRRGMVLSTTGRWECSAYSLEKVPPEKRPAENSNVSQIWEGVAGEVLHSFFPKWDRMVLYLVAIKKKKI